jgi:hypothetical protein
VLDGGAMPHRASRRRPPDAAVIPPIRASSLTSSLSSIPISVDNQDFFQTLRGRNSYAALKRRGNATLLERGQYQVKIDQIIKCSIHSGWGRHAPQGLGAPSCQRYLGVITRLSTLAAKCKKDLKAELKSLRGVLKGQVERVQNERRELREMVDSWRT